MCLCLKTENCQSSLIQQKSTSLITCIKRSTGFQLPLRFVILQQEVLQLEASSRQNNHEFTKDRLGVRLRTSLRDLNQSMGNKVIPTVTIYRHANLPAGILKEARLTGSKLIVEEIYKSLVPELYISENIFIV